MGFIIFLIIVGAVGYAAYYYSPAVKQKREESNRIFIANVRRMRLKYSGASCDNCTNKEPGCVHITSGVCVDYKGSRDV